MFFIIPIVLAIFCPMTYFLVQEIIWPELPLNLGTSYKVVERIIAAPPCPSPTPCQPSPPCPRPRWSPAVTDTCANVFSGKFIIDHGSSPEKTPVFEFPTPTSGGELFANGLLFNDIQKVLICSTILFVVAACGVYYYCRRSKASKSADITQEPMIHSVFNNNSLNLPITTINSPAIAPGLSTLDLACTSCQVNEKGTQTLSDEQGTTKTGVTALVTKMGTLERHLIEIQDIMLSGKKQTNQRQMGTSDCGENENTKDVNMESLRLKIQTQSKHITELQAQCDEGDEHQRTILDLQTTINKKGKEHKSEINKLSCTHLVEVETLEKKLEEAKRIHAAAQATAEDLRIKLSKSLDYNKANVTSKDTLQQALDIKTEDLRKKHAEAESVKAQLNASKPREHELNDKLQAMEKTLAVKVKIAKSLGSSLEQKEKEIAELEKGQLEQSNVLGEAYAKQTELKNKLKTVNKHQSTLEAEFSSFRSAAATKVQTFDQMRTQLTAAEARAIAAETALATKQANNTVDKDAAAQNDTRVRQLNEEVTELRKLSKKVDKLESELFLKQKINEQLKQNAEAVKLALQKDVSEVRVEKSKLEKELQQLKTKMSAEAKQAQLAPVTTPTPVGPSPREIQLEILVKNHDTETSQLRRKHEQALKAAQEGGDRQDFIDMLQENHAAEKQELQLKASTYNYEKYLLENEITKLQAELEKVKTTADTPTKQTTATPGTVSAASSSSMKDGTASTSAQNVAVAPVLVQAAKPMPLSKSKGMSASKWAVDSSSTTPATASTKKSDAASAAATVTHSSATLILPSTPVPAPTVTSTSIAAPAPATAPSTYRTFAERTQSTALASHQTLSSSASKTKGNGGSKNKERNDSDLKQSKWAR